MLGGAKKTKVDAVADALAVLVLLISSCVRNQHPKNEVGHTEIIIELVASVG